MSLPEANTGTKPVAELNPRVPEMLGQLIMQCVEASPDDRPTMDQVVDRLHPQALVGGVASRLVTVARDEEQVDAPVEQACRLWRQWQPELNPARLVFIDGTWAATNMACRYGRSRRASLRTSRASRRSSSRTPASRV